MSKVYLDVYLRSLWNLWLLTQPDQSYKVVYANFDEMRRHAPAAPNQWLELIEKMDTFHPREPMQLRKSLTTNTLEIYQESMDRMVCEDEVASLAARIEKSSFVTTAVEMLFTKQYDNVSRRRDYIPKMEQDIMLMGKRPLAEFVEFTSIPYRDCMVFMSRLLYNDNIDPTKYFVNGDREEEGMIMALAIAVMRHVLNEQLEFRNRNYDDVISEQALELFKDPEWAKKLVTEWVDKIRNEG